MQRAAKARAHVQAVGQVVRARPWVLVAPLLVFALLAVVGVWAAVYAARLEARHEQAQALWVARSTAQQCSSALRTALLPAEVLAALVPNATYERVAQRFGAVAPPLHTAAPGLLSLQLGPAGVVRMAYPPEGSGGGMLGMDLLAVPDPAYSDSLRASPVRPGVSVLGPLASVPGQAHEGPVLVVRQAVHLPTADPWDTFGRPDEPNPLCGAPCGYNATSGTKFWGLVHVVLSLDAFLEGAVGGVPSAFALRSLSALGYRYRLTGPGGVLVAASGAAPQHAVTATVELPGMQWLLEVGTSGSWTPSWLGGAIAAVVLAALAAALVLFGLLLSRRRHQLLLEALVPRDLLRGLHREHAAEQLGPSRMHAESPAELLLGLTSSLLSGVPPDLRDVVLLRTLVAAQAHWYAPLDMHGRIKNANLDDEVARALMQQLGSGDFEDHLGTSWPMSPTAGSGAAAPEWELLDADGGAQAAGGYESLRCALAAITDPRVTGRSQDSVHRLPTQQLQRPDPRTSAAGREACRLPLRLGSADVLRPSPSRLLAAPASRDPSVRSGRLGAVGSRLDVAELAAPDAQDGGPEGGQGGFGRASVSVSASEQGVVLLEVDAAPEGKQAGGGQLHAASVQPATPQRPSLCGAVRSVAHILSAGDLLVPECAALDGAQQAQHAAHSTPDIPPAAALPQRAALARCGEPAPALAPTLPLPGRAPRAQSQPHPQHQYQHLRTRLNPDARGAPGSPALGGHPAVPLGGSACSPQAAAPAAGCSPGRPQPHAVAISATALPQSLLPDARREAPHRSSSGVAAGAGAPEERSPEGLAPAVGPRSVGHLARLSAAISGHISTRLARIGLSATGSPPASPCPAAGRSPRGRRRSAEEAQLRLHLRQESDSRGGGARRTSCLLIPAHAAHEETPRMSLAGVPARARAPTDMGSLAVCLAERGSAVTPATLRGSIDVAALAGVASSGGGGGAALSRRGSMGHVPLDLGSGGGVSGGARGQAEPWAPPPPPPVLDEVERLLGRVDELRFDTWALAEASGGHALSALGYYLLTREGLAARFGMQPARLVRLLRTLEAGYVAANPYHNATHAADVLRTLHVLVHGAGLTAHYLDPLGLLAAYFAAIVHDYGHPGLNNDFLVATSHPLALRYNDRSPLESHHTASVFTLLAERPELDVLSGLSREERVAFRKQVIELVLGTDMKQHFSLVSQFTTAHRVARDKDKDRGHAAGGGGDDPGADVPGTPRGLRQRSMVRLGPMPLDEGERVVSLQALLKAADLGHLSGELAVHKRWVGALEEEFFRQGDRERELGLPISPLFDRLKQGVSKSQVGFFDFVVLPLVRSLAEVFPGAQPLVSCYEDNYRYWQREAEAAAAQEGGSKA